MADHPEYEELITDALFGEISAEDRRRLEAHLDRCEACREEFASLRAALELTAERERPDLPEAYWRSFRRRVMAQVRSEGGASVSDDLARWWRSLPRALPRTRLQWALQSLVLVLMLGAGWWLGRWTEPIDSEAGLVTATDSSASSETIGLTREGGAPSQAAEFLLARETIDGEGWRVRPRFEELESVSVGAEDGTVEIHYRTVNQVTVTAPPSAPVVRHLLTMALLDAGNPSARLGALQVIESSTLSPSEELIRALQVLIRDERWPALQTRAVSALRRLHAGRPLEAGARSLLVGIVLDEGSEPLRIEALKTLMVTRDSTEESGYLYAVRNDPNDYVRYAARSRIRSPDLPPTGLTPSP